MGSWSIREAKGVLSKGIAEEVDEFIHIEKVFHWAEWKG